MKLLTRNKIIAFVLAGFLIFSISVASAFSKNNYLPVSGEADYSTDAGIFDVVDDFRFNGLTENKEDLFLTEFDNVSTAEYGSYSYGLIPANEFNSTVNTGSGSILYQIKIEGNGLFFIVRNLELKLNYLFKTGNNAKIIVSYASENKDAEYNIIEEISQNFIGEKQERVIDLTDLIESQDLSVQNLYVKINLIHDEKELPVEDVSLNLFSVEFSGMHNFVMKKGASVRQTSSTARDLFYRVFIAVDCYNLITEKYSSDSFDIKLGNIIMPVDYIKLYDAVLDKDRIRFVGDDVYINYYDYRVTSSLAASFNGASESEHYIVTVNGVDYYYFDGSIRNVMPKNIARDFMSRSYIRVMGDAGQVFFTVAAFNNQQLKNNSRSAFYTAQRSLSQPRNFLPKWKN
ncbi:MAG: hypothetical protein SPL13_03915 [Clostridia bacterium]|nr:hypothetical protein [Clostridia bacterium]